MASQGNDWCETVEFGVVCSNLHCHEGTTVTVTPMRHNRAVNHFQVNTRLRAAGWEVAPDGRRFCPACKDDFHGVLE